MNIKNLISAFLIFLLLLPSSEATYKKLTQERGLKIQLDIDELAALNFLLLDSNSAAEIHGEPGEEEYTIFSGKNFNMEEIEVAGEKEAIKLNLSTSLLNTSNITLEGSPPTEGEFDYSVEMDALAAVIKKNANIALSEDTTYINISIGSEDNFQIVSVSNAELTLLNGFSGYGILYIEDRSHSESDPILEMLGDAAWYGLIIINQTESKNSKIYLKGAPAMNLEDFALVGIESIIVGNNLTINSGAIGAYLDGGEVAIGDNANLASSIIGDSITLGNNATVSGDIYYNTQFTTGVGFIHTGDEISPASIPFSGLPDFPTFEAGTQNIAIATNATHILTPGNYNDITMGNNVTLILSEGTYNINKISAGNNCLISYQNPVDINIKGKIEFGNTPKIKPENESVGAEDCIFYVEGIDYEGEDVFYYEDVFIAYNHPELYCNIYAPNSTVKIGNYGQYKGAIIAKHIISGSQTSASIELGSAFTSPPTYVKVYGSIVLSGDTFHIPDSGSNSKVYFSYEALTKVNELLQSLPITWEKWREVE
ncbi:MAG: hypothetical protein P9L98_06195 [Candidatus Kaelpia imicola]|nr:hypothetical protein [Candidatus Kaelpia imicola]